MKHVKNENLQKLIILEGFSQNGLQIWIQQTFLHRIACRFDISLNILFSSWIICVVNRVFEKGVGYLLLIWSIQKLIQTCRNLRIYQIYKRLLKHFSKTRFACLKTRWKQGANPRSHANVQFVAVIHVCLIWLKVSEAGSIGSDAN